MKRKELIRVDGLLPRAFHLGHITYTVVLEEPMERLRIVSTFDKHKIEPEHRDELAHACREAIHHYVPLDQVPPAAMDRLLNIPKTEINLSVFFNEELVGCMLKDLTRKEIVLSPEDSTVGFLPFTPRPGVLKIVLHVQNVLNDNTHYTLAVEGD